MKKYLTYLLVCGAMLNSCQSMFSMEIKIEDSEHSARIARARIPFLLLHFGPQTVLRLLHTPKSEQPEKIVQRFLKLHEAKSHVSILGCPPNSNISLPWRDSELQSIQDRLAQEFKCTHHLTHEAAVNLLLFFQTYTEANKEGCQKKLEKELEELQYSKEEIEQFKAEATAASPVSTVHQVPSSSADLANKLDALTLGTFGRK